MVITENAQEKVEVGEDILNTVDKVCQKALSMLQFEECEISVTFVDNEEIRKINKEHRDIDRPTDVLSFPMLEFDENKNPIDMDMDFDPDSEETVLGDIIISLEKAEEQAKEYGHSLIREVAFLSAHSMLHLLGYDHMNDDDEKEMFALQEKILDELGITRD